MSLDCGKTDYELGKRVLAYLEAKGVETPRIKDQISPSAKVDVIEKNFKEILTVMGLDLTDDSLKDTPRRVATMYINEMYWGLDPQNFPKITAVENKMGYKSMVIEKNIVVHSTCEHHFVMIDGYAHVAYIPKDKVLGLSKMNRVVEYFSRRPQIQERLTEQIYFTLEHVLETPDIAVMISAKHYCVKARGVEDINCETITSKMGGCFKDDMNSRNEFLSLIRSAGGV
jgi:GTP cyclohydrolase I